jgi:hypothetical protein
MTDNAFPVPHRVYIEKGDLPGRWEIVWGVDADDARREANELFGPDGFEVKAVQRAGSAS